jgi:PKD repeat protein
LDLSSAGTAEIMSWTWDFGDNATSTEREPTHVYAAPGQYTVKLTVRSSAGVGSKTLPNHVTVQAPR